MAKRSDPIIIELLSTGLERIEAALRHATAVAAMSRPVIIFLSGPAVIYARKDAIRRAKRGGASATAVRMRQEVLDIADAHIHMEAIKALPVSLVVDSDDARDYALDIGKLIDSPSVEIKSRAELIAKTGIHAWMVF